MAVPLDWSVDEGPEAAVVTVRGRLGEDGAPGLRTALLECLAEQPDALVIDVSGMEVAETASLGVFRTVARQAARWPDAPVLLCGPRTAEAAQVDLPVHPDVAAAMRSLHSPPESDSAGYELLPVPGAARYARDRTTEACVRWDLSELVGPASVVVSELVSNAIEHAGTIVGLSITRRGGCVHVAVRDGVPAEPEPARPGPDDPGRGRGLMLVQNLSVRWGWLPSRGGKVVWATLAAPE